MSNRNRAKKRLFAVACALAGTALVVWLLFLFPRGSSRDISSVPSLSSTGGAFFSDWPSLCVPEHREVDFTVLKDIEFIVKNYSVFTSSALGSEFGKTQKNEDGLMRQTLVTLFNFLSTSVPSWASALVEQEIVSGKYDYDVFNKIYNRLIADSAYSYLEDPQKKEELLQVMGQGMIDALGDPFTNYISPEMWILTNRGSIEGKYRGLGVILSKNERKEIEISSVSSGQPADKVGLRPGDAIVAVDGKTTFGCTVAQFILSIKKRQDPVLNLLIRRQFGGDELENIRVVMEDVEVRAIESYPGVDLPGGRGSTSDNFPYFTPFLDRDGNLVQDILYIGINEFSLQAANDLRYVLGSLDLTRFRGIVIDVRDNPGGRVDAIVDTVDYFLPEPDLIFTEKDRKGFVTEYHQDKFDLVPEEIPIVILVNKNSYSGAELFPAALRDNGRAIILSEDERTGGKGSVNTYYELRKGEYGAVYVSIALWYTPAGELIEARDLDNDGIFEVGGLRPDIRVEWTDDDIAKKQREPAWWDPTLFEAIDFIRRK